MEELARCTGWSGIPAHAASINLLHLGMRSWRTGSGWGSDEVGETANLLTSGSLCPSQLPPLTAQTLSLVLSLCSVLFPSLSILWAWDSVPQEGKMLHQMITQSRFMTTEGRAGRSL